MTTSEVAGRTGFEKWRDGIDKAVGDDRWNSLDCEIQTTVDAYNRHLSKTPGYKTLDWRLIKAMVWVETGANHPAWHSRPMQIGVAGDPGLAALLSGNEGGGLILPPAWKGKLTTAAIRATPANNIRAGVGYLLTRMAKFEHRSMPGEDARVYEVVVRPGDSLEKIAREQGSTVDMLKKSNPSVTTLRPGQTLAYRKASVRRVISGWRQLSTASIAQRYNGGGDPNYARKLDYASSLINTARATSCAN